MSEIDELYKRIDELNEDAIRQDDKHKSELAARTKHIMIREQLIDALRARAEKAEALVRRYEDAMVKARSIVFAQPDLKISVQFMFDTIDAALKEKKNG